MLQGRKAFPKEKENNAERKNTNRAESHPAGAPWRLSRRLGSSCPTPCYRAQQIPMVKQSFISHIGHKEGAFEANQSGVESKTGSKHSVTLR